MNVVYFSIEVKLLTHLEEVFLDISLLEHDNAATCDFAEFLAVVCYRGIETFLIRNGIIVASWLLFFLIAEAAV